MTPGANVLTSITLDARRSSTGPDTVELRNSLGAVLGTSSPLPSATFAPVSFALNNLASTTVFRLFGFGSTGTTVASTGTFRVDNVTVNGDPASTPGPTPVPTPALLPGLVGMGLSLLRKRKSEVA